MRCLARSLVAFVAPVLVLAACGSGGKGGGGGGNPDAAGGGIVDAAPGGGADADVAGFTKLITSDWTLGPYSGSGKPDLYQCATLTVPSDMYITAFRSLSPAGTHHAVASIGPASSADNPAFGCSFIDNAATILDATGVGTDDFTFPDGVAVKVTAGQQLFLNLHLFNLSLDQGLAGTSGIYVKTVPVGQVQQLADFSLAGTLNLNIASTGAPVTATGTCSFDAPATILNIWPHMHQLGTHMKVEHDSTVVLDENFSFSDQKNWPVDFTVAAGDTFKVTCTYINNTGSTVHFGDSSTTEMCFAGFYRYPVGSGCSFSF